MSDFSMWFSISESGLWVFSLSFFSFFFNFNFLIFLIYILWVMNFLSHSQHSSHFFPFFFLNGIYPYLTLITSMKNSIWDVAESDKCWLFVYYFWLDDDSFHEATFFQVGKTRLTRLHSSYWVDRFVDESDNNITYIM